MSYLDLARELDRNDKPAESAWAYELALRVERFALENYLDLVGLYFQILDPGFSAYHHLAPGFCAQAAVRLPEVLDEAREAYGRAPEIQFWAEYWRYIHLGDPQPKADNYAMSAKAGGDPVFFLFASKGIKEYEAAARKLMMRIGQAGTTRERYIVSVLQAAFGRQQAPSSGNR